MPQISVKQAREIGMTDTQICDLIQHQQQREAERKRKYRANVPGQDKCPVLSPDTQGILRKSSSSSLPSQESKKDNTLLSFDRAWSLWPKRKGDNAKGHARKAWLSAIKRVDADRLIAAIKAYASSGSEEIGTQYQKMMSSWLNAESYESFLPRETKPVDFEAMRRANGGQDAGTTQPTTLRPDTRMGQNGRDHTAQLRPESRGLDGPSGCASPLSAATSPDRRG